MIQDHNFLRRNLWRKHSTIRMSYKIILILINLSCHKFYLIVALLPRPVKIESVLTIKHSRCNHQYPHPNLTIQYLLPAQILILFHHTRNRPLQHQHQGSKFMETLTLSLQLLRSPLYRTVLFHIVLALLQPPTLLIPTSLLHQQILLRPINAV